MAGRDRPIASSRGSARRTADLDQNGLLGSEPARPVFIVHVPQGGDNDAKRRMLKKINTAVAEAYHLPDEHALEAVAINGGILADDLQRVEDQAKVHG